MLVVMGGDMELNCVYNNLLDMDLFRMDLHKSILVKTNFGLRFFLCLFAESTTYRMFYTKTKKKIKRIRINFNQRNTS